MCVCVNGDIDMCIYHPDQKYKYGLPKSSVKKKISVSHTHNHIETLAF